MVPPFSVIVPPFPLLPLSDAENVIADAVLPMVMEPGNVEASILIVPPAPALLLAVKELLTAIEPAVPLPWF